MSWKLRVLVSALLLAPTAAIGLGLGELRLRSALNEPMSAEIDLVAATPEELAVLEAKLATVEVFQRYGLERPAYLDSFEFSVGRGQDGRNVLRVRSRDAITEPFVSFLVDVNWSRGRLLREFTVLLDPPVLAPPATAAATAPITTPRTTPVAPAPTAETAPPAEAAPAAPGADSYRVETGDTLYEIAGALGGGGREATQKMMIGLYRANPEAFANNINVVRAGAILRVPAADELAAIAPGDAAAEVSRQNAAWRASGGGVSGRLRLVTPEEGAGAGAGGQAGTSGDVQSQIDSLERDINEQQRLLELKNQELAKLQQDLARQRVEEAAAAEKAAADQAAADAAAAQPAEQPVDEAPVAPEDVAPGEVPAEPVAEGPGAQAPAEPVAEAPERSIFERLTDNWMFLLGVVALLVVGGLGYGYARRRKDDEANRALRSFDVPVAAPIPTETLRLRALEATHVEESPAFEDEEDVVVAERPVARPKAEAPRPAPVSAGHEETISAEAALDLDQADPLAEADFHMAYGLYDQAVDLVRMALQHSPDRNDLKLKLAEIHFVAGDTPQFLNVARDLKKSLGPGGDWDRIVIMGRQLAPDEPMFAGGVQDAGVDLSLEGGDNRVDLDLLSAPEGDEGLDLDLGKVAVTTDDDDPTGEATALVFNLDEDSLATATTQELPRRDGPQTVEMPTIQLPSSDTPTVETPVLKSRGGDTVRERVSGAEFGGMSADATAEMAIDDLGLDVGSFDVPDGDDETAIATGTHEAQTQIAPHLERTQRLYKPGDEATAVMPSGDTGGTSIVKKLDIGSGLDFEFDDVGADTDVRDAAPTVREDRLATEQLPRLSELEPVTMSEVGTKLDLARAYMDMGDPDGARNILQEVLAEGSASQKQEARRLIDSLPGA